MVLIVPPPMVAVKKASPLLPPWGFYKPPAAQVGVDNNWHYNLAFFSLTN
jgi:hypothetical protein